MPLPVHHRLFRTLCAVLLLASNLVLVSRVPMVVADFLARREAIAATECVQRAVADNDCQGCCQLARRLGDDEVGAGARGTAAPPVKRTSDRQEGQPLDLPATTPSIAATPAQHLAPIHPSDGPCPSMPTLGVFRPPRPVV